MGRGRFEGWAAAERRLSLTYGPDSAGDACSVDCIDGEIVGCPDVQRADIEGIGFIYLVIAEEAVWRETIPDDIEVGAGYGLPLYLRMALVGGIAVNGKGDDAGR